MQYTILVNETAADFARRSSAEAPVYWGAYMAYNAALAAAGVFVGGAGLQAPATGTTVRLRAGARQVQDGPFADTKEQLGGYYVIEVPHLDAALEWAAKCPAAATGSVEVRPHVPMPG